MFIKIAQRLGTTFEAIQTARSSSAVRQVIDFVHFALGFVGLHNVVQTYYFKKREITEFYDNFPIWQQRAFKIADFFGNLSLILGGLKSQPAIDFSKCVIRQVLSTEQLASLLGRQPDLGQKIYKNIAILSILVGIPATVKTFYLVYSWIHYTHLKRFEEQEEHFYTPLPIKKIDVAITVKTVSETAQRLMQNSHNS